VQAFSCLLKVLRTMFIQVTSPKGQGRLPTDRGLTSLKWFTFFTLNAIMFIDFYWASESSPFLFHLPFLFYVSFIFIVKIIPYKCHPTQLNPKLQITLTLRGGLVSV